MFIFDGDANLGDIAADYLQDVNVLSVEIDIPATMLGDVIVIVPNDHWYNLSFGTNPYGCEDASTSSDDYNAHERQWYLTNMDLPRAWAVGTGDSSQIIGLCDEELAIWSFDLHERRWRNIDEIEGDDELDDDGDDLLNNKWGWDFWTPGGGQWVWSNDPDSTHGTFVGGVFGASTNNEASVDTSRYGIAGINWQNKIMPYRAVSTLQVRQAFENMYDRIVDHDDDIKVINLSLDWRIDNFNQHPLLQDAFDDLIARDVLIVAGAGNDDDDDTNLPCNYPGVLCASCVDTNNVRLQMWCWDDELEESYACGSDYSDYVDLCGYGSVKWNPIWDAGLQWKNYEEPYIPFMTLTHTNELEDSRKFCYNDTIGGATIAQTRMMTSGCTAQATGIASLIRSVYPNLTAEKTIAMMKRGSISVDDIEGNQGKAWEGKLGAGVMNAYRSFTLWGDVVRDTILSGEVWIAGDVVVSDTLIIDAGTIIHVAPDDMTPANYSGQDSNVCEIIVKTGDVCLDINGTLGNKVKISGWSNNPEEGDWGGIIIDKSAGSVEIEYLELKHADIGIYADGKDIDITYSDFDSCGTGVYIYGSGGVLEGVKAENCGDKGFYATGNSEGSSIIYASATFDSCIARNNYYGFYFGAYADSCEIFGHSKAEDNTLDGLLCRSGLTIGPTVYISDNGQNGIHNINSGSGVIKQVYIHSHSSGVGCKSDSTSNPEIKDSYISDNYDNVSANHGARPCLGDSVNSLGKCNSIEDATRYHVANYNRNWTLMAELCYWGECDHQSQLPALNIFGSVDLTPYLCVDQHPSWRLPQHNLVRRNWSSKNYPNPFNPFTRIDYQVALTGSLVEIKIFDVSGRLIRNLLREKRAAGEYTVIWDGRDDGGRLVASGLYFSHVKIGRDYEVTDKLMLIK
jgi:hypothetical protein